MAAEGRGMSIQLHYNAEGEQNFERVQSPAYRSTFHFWLHPTSPSLLSEDKRLVDKRLVLPALRVRIHYFHTVSKARVSIAVLAKIVIISLDWRKPRNVCTRQLFITEFW